MGSVNDVALDALDLDRMKQVSVSFPERPGGARGWGLSWGHMGRQAQWDAGGHQKSARNQQRRKGVPMSLPEQRAPSPFRALCLPPGLPPPGCCALPRGCLSFGRQPTSPSTCRPPLCVWWGVGHGRGRPRVLLPHAHCPARPPALLHRPSLLLFTWRLCSRQEILEEVVRELHKVKEEIIDGEWRTPTGAAPQPGPCGRAEWPVTQACPGPGDLRSARGAPLPPDSPQHRPSPWPHRRLRHVKCPSLPLPQVAWPSA